MAGFFNQVDAPAVLLNDWGFNEVVPVTGILHMHIRPHLADKTQTFRLIENQDEVHVPDRFQHGRPFLLGHDRPVDALVLFYGNVTVQSQD